MSVIVCLAVWTAKADYGWVRLEVDEVSGESLGLCTGVENTNAYFSVIYVLNFIPVVLALIMAWRTLGLDDAYAESKWILVSEGSLCFIIMMLQLNANISLQAFILVQIQVGLVISLM